MIYLSCIGLFSLGHKLDNFVEKNYFWFKPLLLSIILVPLLVDFTSADRFFKRLFGLRNKRCRRYTSLFSNMNAKFSKECIICSRKILVFMCQSSLYFSAPPPLSVSAPSFSLLWLRHWNPVGYISQHNQSFQFQYFNFFHCDNIFLKHIQRRASQRISTKV